MRSWDHAQPLKFHVFLFELHWWNLLLEIWVPLVINLSDSLVSSPASLQQVHAARPSGSLGRDPGMTESCHTEIEEAARVGRSSGWACQIGVNIAGLNIITTWTAAYGWQELRMARPASQRRPLWPCTEKTGPKLLQWSVMRLEDVRKAVEASMPTKGRGYRSTTPYCGVLKVKGIYCCVLLYSLWTEFKL
jgi:hypothetical protein